MGFKEIERSGFLADRVKRSMTSRRTLRPRKNHHNASPCSSSMVMKKWLLCTVFIVSCSFIWRCYSDFFSVNDRMTSLSLITLMGGQNHDRIWDFSFPENDPKKVETSSLNQMVETWKGNFLFRKGPFCSEQDCLISYPNPSATDHATVSYQGKISSYIATSKGQKIGPNQDQSILVQGRNFLLAALFDGHGNHGHEAAARAVLELPTALLLPPETVARRDATSLQSEYLRQAFLRTDQGPMQQIPDAGSTAVVVWYTGGSSLYLASAGDSTALLVRYREQGQPPTVVVAQAVKHKPADPIERQRIESVGGTVMLPPPWMSSINGLEVSSRVIIPAGNGQELGLAMSRSLGDMEGKLRKVLTAEPSIIVLEEKELSLTKGSDDFLFVVVASDGVMDMVETETAISMLGQALKMQDEDALSVAGRQIMNQAAQNWTKHMQGTYRDDMTLVAARLDVS